MKQMALALSLLVLASIAFAQAPPMPSVCDESAISNYWTGQFGNWPDICAIGILISFFLIAIYYMFAQAFGKPELVAWCKKELFQVLVSAIILGGIIGFMNFTCTFIKPSLFISVAGNPTLFDYGISYLQWLRNISYTIYVGLAFLNSVLIGVTGTMVYQSPGGLGVNLRPLYGLSALSGLITTAMSGLLVGGIITTIAQLRMLRAIQLMGFNVLLPIGLFSRCFQPTRRFGGSMIAIALGLYLFYPFLLMLNGGVVQNSFIIESGPDSVEAAVIPIMGINYATALSPGAAADLYQNAQNPANPCYNQATGPCYQQTKTYLGLFNGIFTFLLRVLAATIFLPLFNFILLIIFIRNLSQVLGEEVDITNVTRLL